MKILHQLIIEKRNDINYLLAIIPFCNIDHLSFIVKIISNSKHKDLIYNQIQKYYDHIKILKKNNGKYIIKLKKIFSSHSFDINILRTQINSRGCSKKLIIDTYNNNYEILIMLVQQKMLNEVGCKNIIDKINDTNLINMIYKYYQNIEFIRCSSFNNYEFNSWIKRNQYIYLKSNQELIVKKIQNIDINKINIIFIDKMLKSNNDARRHLGVLLSNHFNYIELLKQNNMHYDNNKIIRESITLPTTLSDNNKILQMFLTWEYPISVQLILQTLDKLPDNITNINIFIEKQIPILSTFLPLNKNQIFNYPGLLHLFYYLPPIIGFKKCLRSIFFNFNYILKMKNNQNIIDYFITKDWTIVKESLSLFLKYKMTKEFFIILLHTDHNGIILHAREIFKNYLNYIGNIEIDICTIINISNKNCRKSGGISMFCELVDISYDKILYLYINNTEVHIKFHCMNSIEALFRKSTLNIYNTELLYMKKLFIDNDIMVRKKIFLSNITNIQLNTTSFSTFTDNFKAILYTLSVITNTEFILIDTVSFILALAFDAMNNQHFSIVNSGISLYALLLQKISFHFDKIYYYFNNTKLREFLYYQRYKHTVFILKIYELIFNKLNKKELEFIHEIAQQNNYESLLAKNILYPLNFDINYDVNIKFKTGLEEYKIFFYLFKILNFYDEIEINLVLKYIKDKYNINAMYCEDARIQLANKAKMILSTIEMSQLVLLLKNYSDSFNICDFDYDIENLTN